MNLAAWVLLLLAHPALASTRTASSGPGPVHLSGHEYVRIRDWGRVHGFQMGWTRHQDRVELASRWSKLAFTVDSTRAEINGVAVFLSVPVASRGGDGYIALADLQTTVQPVLFPPRTRSSFPIMSICLDPGHGGKDPGNEAGRRKEKDQALLLAWDVRRLLSAAGLKVVLTRTTDSFVPLAARPELAKRRGADLFVSLHFNAAIADRQSVRGVEVYCLTPAGAGSTHARGEGSDTGPTKGNLFDAQNVLLAYQIQKSMVRSLGAEDRGVRRARFAVLRNVEMPAALIEAGFMSHPEESARIFSAEYRGKLARSIADGILAYQRLVEHSN